MPEPTAQIHRTLTSRTERKELLVLACEVDRTAWRQACQPPRQSAQFARDMLGYLQAFSSFLPGRWGSWVRTASFVADLVRKLGLLRL